MNPWQASRAKLFTGDSSANMATACLDRHVVAGRGDRLAFRFLDRELTARDLTYGELTALGNRFANVLEGSSCERARRTLIRPPLVNRRSGASNAGGGSGVVSRAPRADRRDGGS